MRALAARHVVSMCLRSPNRPATPKPHSRYRAHSPQQMDAAPASQLARPAGGRWVDVASAGRKNQSITFNTISLLALARHVLEGGPVQRLMCESLCL